MSSQGIDVRLALEILSLRSPENHDHGDEADACRHHASSETQSLGQVINIAPSEDISIQEETKDLIEQQNLLKEEREKRRSELRVKLESMSLDDLLQTVLEAQQQRVKAYHSFDTSLDSILSTRNLTNYPSVCAEATAHFAVVSDTVLSIHSCLLEKMKRPDLAQLVHNLQQHEKEKLSLTAALHLERIRESQGGEQRILALVKQEIQSLENRIRICCQEINDNIEEILCALSEE
jgi:hypothetical protein